MKNNIRKYREINSYTLLQLSNIVDLSVGYLCHLENGSRSNPSYEVMKKLANALNSTIDELFFE